MKPRLMERGNMGGAVSPFKKPLIIISAKCLKSPTNLAKKKRHPTRGALRYRKTKTQKTVEQSQYPDLNGSIIGSPIPRPDYIIL
ncbi:hypothetical protein HMPREF9374_3115 [Desmospora sp. 8437]|nr:hypothetical protein HMPREF9374_3115 [Desmospora sp. 8437]